MAGSILRKPGNCGLVGSRKHFLYVMAFTEHMTGLAITWHVYMSANEITALQTSIRKRYGGGTFDIWDDHLKGEWHLSRDRFLLRYQTCWPVRKVLIMDRIQHRQVAHVHFDF
jgi:hypothetical protein